MKYLFVGLVGASISVGLIYAVIQLFKWLVAAFGMLPVIGTVFFIILVGLIGAVYYGYVNGPSDNFD